jgi:hypothetical protein
VFDDKLKLFGSLRWDYNPEFDPKLLLAGSSVYAEENLTTSVLHTNKAIAFLHCLKALSYVNNGRVSEWGVCLISNERPGIS